MFNFDSNFQESCWAFQAYAQDNGISRSLLRQVAQIIFDTLAASRNTDMRLHEYTFVQTHKSFPMFRASNIGTAVTADLPRLQALEDDLVLPPLSRSRLAAPGGVTSLAVADIKKLRNDGIVFSMFTFTLICNISCSLACLVHVGRG